MSELQEQMRRRLDEVFGEVLPGLPADERDDRPGADADVELLANRPPHHEERD